METAGVRYLVHDVEQAVEFYTGLLEFVVVARPASDFAILQLGALRLYVNAMRGEGGAAQPMPDGELPEPGGWNRILLEVEGLEEKVAEFRRRGARFRNELVTGRGGRQILLADPSGNLVELFEPGRVEPGR